MQITNIIFDWKRTLYDPDEDVLLDGAREILEWAAEHHIQCILIGKGGPEMSDKVVQFGLHRLFDEIQFVGAEKDPQTFNHFINQAQPLATLVVGDRARAEIEIGNQLGATTIWVKQGKFAVEEPLNETQQADFVVNSLRDFHWLLREKYLK